MIRHICLTLLSTSLIALPAQANGWKAGVAKTIITPAPNGWMSGYAARKGPATGKAHDLWAKAFALQDVNGKKSVIVTLDVCGITRDVELPVVAEIEKKTGIPRAGIALSVSHTHCGPVVGDNLISMYPLTATELAKTKAYTDVLKTKLASVAIEAVAGLQPAQISWGMGKCNFAVNRRENPADQVPALRQKLSLKGPVDHDVPVLVAKGADGNPLGILTQYACHCTTLDYDKYSGDYAGYTQIELEKEFPGAVALFAAGCGADANPLPRRNEEMAIQYGKELATATVNVVRHGLQPLSGDRLGVAFEEIPLKLSKIPTKAELEKELADKNIYIAARAKVLLKKLADDGSLSPTYPYPVQVWKLGNDLDWFLLGGEVVVDYSLRLKRSNGANRTWVTAYTNDVCAYIPSLRVLKEGGYEGATSMIYYALPSPWAESIEEEIIASIAKLLKSLNP
ncbi:MAG: neutral/alkaline non-lysosomal ceramidase N-terminal domain-containing protein [Planctomycetota bacterium]|nr:neutral/alkaline non-lysosomal ceramidase N-terminal domain-containing protein [Planctomycetota bacterium]